VLQRVAACCSVLRLDEESKIYGSFRVVGICKVLLHVAVDDIVLQCVAVSSVLQCVAVCCGVLQCVAVCCSMMQRAAVCCSVL